VSCHSRYIPYFLVLSSPLFLLVTHLRPIVAFSIFLYTVLLPLCHKVQASPPREVLVEAEQLELANHPTWRKLLHYERNENFSVVLTDSFFLVSTGRYDSKAELIATINAYFLPWGENGNEHARCRFPARYFWLSKKLSLPHYELKEPRCQKLKRWALLDTVKSVSLLSVSGYLGNPASTFGHALLKLNTDSPVDQAGFFDLTINYGALVPEDENSLRYVVRGLFGGYEAGFSDKYFYTEDQVYSRRELRDIWDYRLNLSDDERALLIFHIWEIVGKKFKYYFLNKNCAYRLAELLDLVLEEEVVDSGRFWYYPVELFHRLKDIDEARKKASGKNLIQSVRFIPSSERRLYHQIKLLNEDELIAFNAIVLEGVASMSEYQSRFPVDRQIVLLDSLLAYQQYRLLAEEPHPTLTRRKEKDQILLARLRLPARSRLAFEIPDMPAPAGGSRPMEIGIGVGIDSSENPFLRLNWSAHKKEIVGKNSLEGDEFVVGDFAIGLLEDKNDIFVDKVDLIRILNLNLFSGKVQQENPWSWQLRVGMDRIEKDGENLFDGLASFGIGHGRKWNEHLTGYAMMEFAAHTISPFIQIRPHLGGIIKVGGLRTWVYFGAESIDYKGDFSGVWGGKVQYYITNRYAVRLEFSNELATQASLGINWYW
jgi:Domain of unknown function (DUF4105)